mmetsp:Transcript_34729/g.84030  ORF Transcript_34729/g.84030 Transcript_34729/m.84030 type:complete len:171 (-) Transcript_34729:221-733(-)
MVDASSGTLAKTDVHLITTGASSEKKICSGATKRTEVEPASGEAAAGACIDNAGDAAISPSTDTRATSSEKLLSTVPQVQAFGGKEDIFKNMEKEIEELHRLADEEKEESLADQTEAIKKLLGSMKITEDALFEMCTTELGINPNELDTIIDTDPTAEDRGFIEEKASGL